MKQTQPEVITTRFGYKKLHLEQGKEPELRCIIDYVDYIHMQDLQNRQLFLVEAIDEGSVWEIISEILEFNRIDEARRKLEGDKFVEKPVRLYINSPGGSVDEGMSLIDVILASKTPIYTVNLGNWYSMAFYIGVAGHKRYALPNSRFLIHEGQSAIYDASKKVEDQIEFSKNMHRRLTEMVVARSKVDAEFLKVRDRIEWYMFADEALSHGFVDKVVKSFCDYPELF